MKQIDLNNWKRREHFLFFHRMDYPHFNICANVTITRFLSFTKLNKLSFYYATIYAATKVANTIDNFKYRIRDGQVVFHDTVHPSFTDMPADKSDDNFKLVTVEMKPDIFTFANYAKNESNNQTAYYDISKLVGRDDLLYITCIPWISFTHLSHTISMNKNDSVPRISWGKYFNQGNEVILPFSVQVNHALADGIHIGMFMEQLQNSMNEPEKFLG